MPTPNLPTVCRVAMLFSRDTRKFVNTFHVRKPTAWVAADLPNVAAAFSTWWSSVYKNQSIDDVCLYQIQVRKYSPSDPLAYDLAVSPVVCGISSAGPGPANATASISWRTGLAGQRFRGRFYAVGLSEAVVDDLDKLTTGYVGGMATAASGLITNIVATGWELVIFHRDTETATAITSVVVENIVDSQRRRLPGRGT